jgi:hypothetical protein
MKAVLSARKIAVGSIMMGGHRRQYLNRYITLIMRRFRRLGRDYGRRTAQSRFAQFQQYLIVQVEGSHHFVDDVPREEIADEAQLSNLAGRLCASHARRPALGDR